MKRKYIIYPLILLWTIMFTGSCSNDDIVTDCNSDTEKVHFTIGVTLPGTSKSETRAFGDEATGSGGYYEFSDLYVAVFVEIEGVSYLDEFVKADNTAPVWDGDNNCWNFGVSLSKTTSPRRLHFIANYPNLTLGFGEEGQLIGRMLADGDNHDVYWYRCDVDKIDENDSDFRTKLQRIPLLRNYVKIVLNDQRTDKSNFTLDGYALYNVPTKGTVAPYNPSGVNKFANFVINGICQSYTYLLDTEKYEGNEPFDDGTLISTDINWINVENGVISPAYMYERSNRTAANPTCMLIKGRYSSDGHVTASTPVTYYKLDFVYNDTFTNSKFYYNLLRNFIYAMNLNNVSGAGYSTVEEAISQPASNNIGGDAVAKDYTNISDGTGHLFVSTTYMMLTSNKEVDIFYKYISSMEQSLVENSEVTVTAPAGNVLSEEASVSTNDERTGQYAGWRKVTLKPKAVSTVSQSQELIFAADGLQRKVELVLRTPYVLTVETPSKVSNVAKTPLDVKITLPTGIAPSLFPLRLFISSKDNTIYPDYGTNMPAEAQNGRYGFIKEVSWDEYNSNSSKTIECRFLTNCEDSATDVYVDNEYFNRGSDSFTNPWKSSVTLGTAIKVDIQKIYGRYPQTIYNGGNNNGSKQVSVALNGENVGTITIDRDNVTQGITFTNSGGLSKNDVVEFTFTDNYWYGQWSDTPITYKATSTLGEIDAGTTLVFTAQGVINKLTSIEITTEQAVSYVKYGDRNPREIHENRTETVDVRLNGNSVGEVVIGVNGVTSKTTLVSSNGFNLDDELKFTFNDQYYSKGIMGWGAGWQDADTYTATCTVEQLLNGITLNFSR